MLFAPQFTSGLWLRGGVGGSRYWLYDVQFLLVLKLIKWNHLRGKHLKSVQIPKQFIRRWGTQLGPSLGEHRWASHVMSHACVQSSSSRRPTETGTLAHIGTRVSWTFQQQPWQNLQEMLSLLWTKVTSQISGLNVSIFISMSWDWRSEKIDALQTRSKLNLLAVLCCTSFLDQLWPWELCYSNSKLYSQFSKAFVEENDDRMFVLDLQFLTRAASVYFRLGHTSSHFVSLQTETYVSTPHRG